MDRQPQFIDRIIELVSPEKIILFGSRARGNATEMSDYDLLILKKDLISNRMTAQMLYKELLPFRVAVDLIVDTPENYDKYKSEKSFIYYQINKSGIVIYEKKRNSAAVDQKG